MLVGYMRVSKADGSQVSDLQRDALVTAGVDAGHLYEDAASGKRDDRPGLAACLKALREGDTLVVWKLDRLGRDLRHLVNTVHGLTERGIGFRVLTGHGANIDTTSASGKLVFGIFAALAEFERELIIERTRALGMQGRVTVSHAFCLGDPDAALVNPLLEQIAALDIAIATTAPASRPVPAAATLHHMGIRLCAGSDGIRDTWGPYGNGDMLERAMLLGLRNNFRRDEEVELALDICTAGGAAVMGLQDYGLAPGCQADFVLVEAESLAEAVAARPPRKLVVKRGRIVARDGTALVEAP